MRKQFRDGIEASALCRAEPKARTDSLHSCDGDGGGFGDSALQQNGGGGEHAGAPVPRSIVNLQNARLAVE